MSIKIEMKKPKSQVEQKKEKAKARNVKYLQWFLFFILGSCFGCLLTYYSLI